VVGEINAACGVCPTCRRGLPRHCPERTVLGILGRGGAFADFLTLPQENLHAIPDGVTDEQAVFVEPLAAAFRILEQVEITSGMAVTVLGDGRLGLLIAQVLAGTGGDVRLVGRHREKLALAEGWGIAVTLGAEPPKADVVVDCTGSPDGFATAISLTRPCGAVVLKTTCAEAPAFNPAPLVIDEITVIGSRCGPFEPAVQALAEGRIDVAPMIDRVFPLRDGEAALARAGERGSLKVLLTP